MYDNKHSNVVFRQCPTTSWGQSKWTHTKKTKCHNFRPPIVWTPTNHQNSLTMGPKRLLSDLRGLGTPLDPPGLISYVPPPTPLKHPQYGRLPGVWDLPKATKMHYMVMLRIVIVVIGYRPLVRAHVTPYQFSGYQYWTIKYNNSHNNTKTSPTVLKTSKIDITHILYELGY